MSAMSGFHRHIVALALVAGTVSTAEAEERRQTTVDLVAEIAAGRTTAEQAVGAALQRIEKASALNAVARLDAARALAAAKAVDKARAEGKPLGPLAGIPFVIKDNIQIAGLPAAAGTPALAGVVSAANAPVVDRLVAAGAIPVATTNMHELAFGISGYNPTYQTGPQVGVRAAYDSSRMAGGSSSGTGALVGAGAVSAGLGTDTGGSVRLPAAINGVAGLRPTLLRYAQDGVVPISHTRDTVGPIAASVADLELIDRVVTGAPAIGKAELKGVRLGIDAAMTAGLDAETDAVFKAALGRLEAAGVELVRVDLKDLAALNQAVSFPVALYEAYDDLAAYLARYAPGMTVASVAAAIKSPDVKGTYDGLVIPRKLPGPNGLVDAKPIYEAAIATGRPALIASYAKAFADNRIDALIFPTVPKVALTAGPETSALDVFLTFIRNTDPGSNAGLPGLTLPIGLTASSRMPVGLELDGPAGSDRRLLALGQSLEAIFGTLAPPK